MSPKATKADAAKAKRKEWVAANPLRAHRATVRMSIMDTAAACESSMSAIQQWESGAVRPTDDKMQLLANFMHVDVVALGRAWDRWAAKQPTA